MFAQQRKCRGESDFAFRFIHLVPPRRRESAGSVDKCQINLLRQAHRRTQEVWGGRAGARRWGGGGSQGMGPPYPRPHPRKQLIKLTLCHILLSYTLFI